MPAGYRTPRRSPPARARGEGPTEGARAAVARRRASGTHGEHDEQASWQACALAHDAPAAHQGVGVVIGSQARHHLAAVQDP